MKKILLFLLGCVLLYTAMRTNLFDQILSTTGRQAISQQLEYTLRTAGWMAPVMFILLITVGCSLMLPASIFTFIGAVVFGIGWGFLLNLIGLVTSGLLTLLVARYFLRELAEKIVGGRFEKYNTRLEHNGFMVVCILRMLMIPHPLFNLGAALTRVRIMDFIAGTFIGTAPIVFIYTYVFNRAGKIALSFHSIADFARPDIICAIIIYVLLLFSLPRILPKIPIFRFFFHSDTMQQSESRISELESR